MNILSFPYVVGRVVSTYWKKNSLSLKAAPNLNNKKKIDVNEIVVNQYFSPK